MAQAVAVPNTSLTPTAAALLASLQAENPITRNLITRIPADQLDWQPHPKSMTIGALGIHIANIQVNLPKMIAADGFNSPTGPGIPAQPASLDTILSTFDLGCQTTTEFLTNLTPEAASQIWALTANGKTAISMPRIQVAQMLLLHHSIHHRGQLSVYLRLLNVSVPVIYGRSADENPFA